MKLKFELKRNQIEHLYSTINLVYNLFCRDITVSELDLGIIRKDFVLL